MTASSDQPTGTDVEALYRRFGPMCLRRAERFLPRHEAEEVLQDMFVKLLADTSRLRHERAPGGWLYRSITRLCIDRLRHTRRYASLLARSEVVAVAETDPQAATEARSFLTALWSKIDPELVMIGVLYHLDGQTTAAIGEQLGVSDRTIANRLRALAEAAALAGGGGAP